LPQIFLFHQLKFSKWRLTVMEVF